MSQTAPPIRGHQWAQAILEWGFHDAESALGRRSIMPAIVAAIEGRSSGWRGISLDEDPEAALEQMGRASRLDAARKYRVFITGLHGMPPPQRVTLETVYDRRPEPRLESFGALANLASDAADPAWRRARATGIRSSRLDFLARLSNKILPGKDERGRRKPPTATDAEQRTHLEILIECQRILTDAIEAWIDASAGARLESRRRAGR